MLHCWRDLLNINDLCICLPLCSDTHTFLWLLDGGIQLMLLD